MDTNLHWNTLVPELLVSDLARSLLFYCDILGFKVEYARREDLFAYISFFGSQLMLEQDGTEESPWRVGPLEYPRGRGLNLSIECPDAQSLVDSLTKNRIPLRKALEECWYRQDDLEHGEKNFLVLDPDGYLLRFAQSLGTRKLG